MATTVISYPNLAKTKMAVTQSYLDNKLQFVLAVAERHHPTPHA